MKVCEHEAVPLGPQLFPTLLKVSAEGFAVSAADLGVLVGIGVGDGVGAGVAVAVGVAVDVGVEAGVAVGLAGGRTATFAAPPGPLQFASMTEAMTSKPANT